MSSERQREAHRRPGAVYFSGLDVAGVRCFGPAQHLDLTDGDRPAKWTIVLGENGVGKTTLLQCLWTMAPYVAAVRPGALVGSHPRGYPGGPRVHGFRRAAGEPLAMTASIVVDELLQSARIGKSSSATFSSVHDQRLDLQSDRSGVYDNFANSVCCGYGALRRSAEGGVEGVESGHSAASLFSDTATLVSASEWFLRADYAAKSSADPRAIERRDRVQAALVGGLLPDVQDVRVAGLDGDNPQPRIEVQTPYGWVPMRALGLGYRSMIAWVVDLASRMFEAYPDATDPLTEPAVALIDEIDLHLHPRWQREITAHLDRVFPNVQFIATAHSPLVVQGAGVTNVAVLRRVADHVEILNDPEEVRGWRVDQILTSDLFGLPSARAVDVEKLLDRQRELVLIDHPSPIELAELERIDRALAEIPSGETATDRRTWALLNDIAARAHVDPDQ